MIEFFTVMMVLTVIALVVGLWFAIVLGALRLAWRYAPQLIVIAILFVIVMKVIA